MDEKLRNAEVELRQLGGLEEEARSIAGRLRSGQLGSDRVRLCALLGYEPARYAVRPVSTEKLEDPRVIAKEIAALGPEALAQATLCIGRLVPRRSAHAEAHDRFLALAEMLIRDPQDTQFAGRDQMDLSSPELADMSSVLMTVDAALKGKLPLKGLELSLRRLVMGLSAFGIGVEQYKACLRAHLVPVLLRP